MRKVDNDSKADELNIGNSYIFHAQGKRDGARILRLYKVTDFAVYDLALVDAPAFHFCMDTCTNGEVA